MNLHAEEATPVRRRNAETTRAAILEAARIHFARVGYEGAGVREIAADAGVDAALVSRYFGGKEELFRAVLSLASRPEEMFYGDAAEFSARMADMIVCGPPDVEKMDSMQIMLRSACSPRAAEAILQMSDERFYRPLAEWLGGPAHEPRARLLGAVMMGMGLARSLSPDFQLDEEGRGRLHDQVRDVIFAIVTNNLGSSNAADGPA